MINFKRKVVVAGLATFMSLGSGLISAQMLEEIVVTAQRRVQSLQEVPISIDAVTGDEIRMQGFRNMDMLADFSPSVLIDDRIQDQDIAIRGVGTTGNNLTLEQAAPTFIDGIHYGRTSQIKNAFIDLERVEVLRGPQPVYFGQNATAGAFSLVTRKPTPEWEGNLSAEVGRFGRRTVEAAAGGPITDTFGIRVAGKWDTMDGFLKDIITGEIFPHRRDWAGRIITQWTPNDQFQATLKYQITDYDGGADAPAFIRTSGRFTPDHSEYNVFLDGFPPYDITPLTSSFSDRLGRQTGDKFFAPGPNYTQRNSNRGYVDIRGIFCDMSQDFVRGAGNCGGYEAINPWDAYLNMTYRFANDIEVSSLTGYSALVRHYNRDNSQSPFLGNVQHREEDYNSWSQEFRLSSATGGTIEWMAGLYWQLSDLALLSNSIRANTRQPIRFNTASEVSEWKSGFATLTFNFMDNRASVDIGGRYTEVDKRTGINAYAATWIFDVEPTSIPANQYRTLPNGWTIPYNTTPSRTVPVEWRGREPIGSTPLISGIREGDDYRGEKTESDFNPQITLRYRPTDNLSTYARWAQAFKAGGFDTGSSTIPETAEQFEFDNEYAENWEVGAKGTFWDGRARANLSLFWMEVKDLQIATTSVDIGGTSQGSFSTNAGLQRVRGAEFDVIAQISEYLRMGVNGAIMDGTMVKYEGAGCTEAEFLVADTGPCISTAESIALIGNNRLQGLIDRSGSQAPRTPDWIFTGSIDYWFPVLNGYKATFNGKFKVSDGYITNVEDFDLILKMNRHADMNLSVGIGDMDDVWRISAWGRNLLQPLPSYNAEYDVNPTGRINTGLSPSHFRTYGVQLEYNF